MPCEDLPGSDIVLSILHIGEETPEEVALVRSVITEESIYGDLRDEDGVWRVRLAADPQIGYLRITKFGDKTEAELTKMLAATYQRTCGSTDS